MYTSDVRHSNTLSLTQYPLGSEFFQLQQVPTGSSYFQPSRECDAAGLSIGLVNKAAAAKVFFDGAGLPSAC